MNKSIHTYLLIVFILASSACRSKKAVVSSELPVLEKKTDPTQEKLDFYAEKIRQKEVSYDFLSMKLDADVKSPDQNISVKAQVRMKKDSIIWISVTPLLGIEAARVLIRTDSIFILNRLQTNYAAYSFAELSKRFGYDLNLRMLQNVMIGRTILPIDRLKNPCFTEDTNRLNIQSQVLTLNDSNPMNYSISMTPMYQVIDQKITQSITAHKAEVLFDDFIKIVLKNNQTLIIPKKHTYHVSTKESIQLKYEYSKIDSDRCEFPFNIPNRYEKVKY